jgi:hypothetical protein
MKIDELIVQPKTQQIIFEAIDMSMINMMMQGLRYLKNVNIAEVKVLQKKHKPSIAKQCFINSYRYILNSNPNAIYVLGYSFIHGIPIEHAWIKENDTYYDVTLDPQTMQGYIKVLELSFADVVEYVDSKQYAPSLYDLNRFYADKQRKEKNL